MPRGGEVSEEERGQGQPLRQRGGIRRRRCSSDTSAADRREPGSCHTRRHGASPRAPPTPHFIGNSRSRILGLACSMTKFKRASMVLSMVILPPWQISITPPRQEGCSLPGTGAGSRYELSIVSFTDFVAFVSALMSLAYSSEAGCRQLFTSATSRSRHLTLTSFSSSIKSPCTISLVINGLDLSWLARSVTSVARESLEILTITSCLAFIFSRRCLLIAMDFSMAYLVSICLTLRS
mmetsp:Transcript_30439/g.77511  ORF Transcript_30439/g.77511 Transcript_30439/m.77511 type:complete len:237 (+) Transcript_30439:158-868(+)